jgi:hypothetical protein
MKIYALTRILITKLFPKSLSSIIYVPKIGLSDGIVKAMYYGKI